MDTLHISTYIFVKSSLLFTQKLIFFLTFKIYSHHHYLQNQKTSLLFTQKVTCFSFPWPSTFNNKSGKLFAFNPESDLLFISMTFDLLQEKLENSQKNWKRKIWFAFNPKTGLLIISWKCFWNRFAFVYMILKKLFAFNLESDLLFISAYDLWPLTMKIGKLFAFNPESDLFFIYVNLKKLKREILICF